ncbi:MAG: hypothetical protein Ta2A_11360 [Treponemataceae bacterium]|nr:MAG: hypothetical protein Ta2A_11360 [Treponemataceae bacterium]
MEYHVIGERELVLAFALVGVTGTIAMTRAEALEAFGRVTGQHLGGDGSEANFRSAGAVERPKVLILTESVAALLAGEVQDWQMKSSYPLIVEVPGIHGHLEGKRTLTDSIREAIGISV